MDERQPDSAASVACYLTALTRTSKTPGIQYLVVNATDVIFEHAGGWADIRRQVSLDDATTMMAYSMSKTITAVAVRRDHPRVSFEPGTKYTYSNIGYWLLGRVVERASGQSFPSHVGEHILRPLAVSPKELGYMVADPAHHATGYLEKYSFMNLAKRWLIDRDLVGDYSGRWLEVRSHYLNGPAFGGLVGTVGGFGTFLQDQLRERSVLFNDTTSHLFYARQQTTRGTAVGTTLGWHIGDRPGTRFFYKEGGGGGFHCMMRVYPDNGVGTVVMTNATGFDVGRLLDTTDASFLRSGQPRP